MAAAQVPVHSGSQSGHVYSRGHVSFAGESENRSREWPGSFHPVFCKVLGNVRLDRFRGRDICVAAGALAALYSRQAAAIERACKLRIKLERGAVVGDSFVERTQFQIGEAAAVERIDVVWP